MVGSHFETQAERMTEMMEMYDGVLQADAGMGDKVDKMSTLSRDAGGWDIELTKCQLYQGMQGMVGDGK